VRAVVGIKGKGIRDGLFFRRGVIFRLFLTGSSPIGCDGTCIEYYSIHEDRIVLPYIYIYIYGMQTLK
jgi:hypothetical protein